MYGEPHRIRALALRLELRSEDLRREADRLAAESDAVAWTSVAADRMRACADRLRGDLHDVARRYDDAARLVSAHAAEVERLLDLVAAAERRVRAHAGGRG
jgi:hypothetical protein